MLLTTHPSSQMGRNSVDGKDGSEDTGSPVDGGDLNAWEYLTKVYDNNDTLDDNHLHFPSETSTSLQYDIHEEGTVDTGRSTAQASLKRDWSVMQGERFHQYNDETITRMSQASSFHHKVPFESSNIQKDQQSSTSDPAIHLLYHSTTSSDGTGAIFDASMTQPGPFASASTFNPYHQSTICVAAVDHLRQHPNQAEAESSNLSPPYDSSCASSRARLLNQNNYTGVATGSTSFDRWIPQLKSDSNVQKINTSFERSHSNVVSDKKHEPFLSNDTSKNNPPNSDNEKAPMVEPASSFLGRIPPYQQFNDHSLLLKPLTPYNFYYRDERDNIVSHISHEDDPLPVPVSDFSDEKMQQLLNQRWYIDPLKAKRIHRKTHGKISFQKLSKIISERWRQLPRRGRDFYRTVARSDEMYYNQHLIKIMQNEGTSNNHNELNLQLHGTNPS